MKVVYRKNGEVVMIGLDVDNGQLSTAEVPDDDRAKQGYQMAYQNGKVIFTPTYVIIKEQEAELQKQEFDDDVAKIAKSKDLTEIKDILTKLVTKVYNQS